ncbi:MAG: phenylacetate--CoA ligase family protein [Gammaproteobacteria bacterium]
MKADRPTEVLRGLGTFLQKPVGAILEEHLGLDPRSEVLQHFKKTAAKVPAYRKFLTDNGVVPEEIMSFEDFQCLPLVDKANYMQKYPLPERCKDGDIMRCDRLAVSSGSTGIPTFWPRAMLDELDVALRFEQVFHYSFRAYERDTLAVVCFPLGNWVGGVFSTSCCWYLAQKGYPLTVATPGNKPDEILRVVKEIGPYFQQTVLLGYPPFLKDVVDTGLAQGIDWSLYQIKFVFAGEVFSEQWRILMMERVGSRSPCHDSAALYGTADGGVLGNETPLSIAIRRFLAENPGVARELFGESRLPTLVQYDPVSRFFEVIEGSTLAVSGDNGVPLVRYHIADRGGILGYREMMEFLKERGLNDAATYGADIEELPLPFVWVFGRADFTVSFYGANVYPENVVVGLEQPEFSDRVSGKFVMAVDSEANGSEFLYITVELLPSDAGDADLKTAIALSIRSQLLRLNSEFANYVPATKQLPIVEMRPFADPEYFPPGVKHRYTRRESER